MSIGARAGRRTSLLNASGFHCCIVTCLALLIATAAWAQAPVGTISGTVRDQSDAVLPGASVTIRHMATGSERNLTSGDDGSFSAPALTVGDYVVTAEL